MKFRKNRRRENSHPIKSQNIEDVLDEMFDDDNSVENSEHDGHDDYHRSVVNDSNPSYSDDYEEDDLSDLEKSNNPNKKSFNSSSLKTIGKVLSFLVVIISLLFVLMYTNKIELFSRGGVGVKAVKLLYNFNNIKQLEENLEDLESMMTEKCYYKTTALNSDKSLNTYLKFKQSSTKVNIIESKPGFVLYSLVNENITESRLFIFTYKLNLFGKIYEVREFEAIDFYSEVQSISDEELDKLIDEWSNE